VVSSVAIGKMLGDWVRARKGAEDYNKTMSSAADTAERLGKATAAALGRQGQSALQDIQEFGSEADRDEFIRKNELEIAGVKKRIEAEKEANRVIEDAWFKEWRYAEGQIRMAASNVEFSKQQLDILQQQRDEALAMFSEAEKEREAKRAEITRQKEAAAAAEKEAQAVKDAKQGLNDEIARQTMTAKQYEIMQAMRTTANKQEQEAIRLLIEKKHKIMETAEAQKKASQLLQEELAWRQQTQAERAQWMSDELIEDLKKAREKRPESQTTSLAATESRLLSGRSSRIDADRQRLELAKKTLEEQTASKKLMENMVANLQTISKNLGIERVWEAN